MLGVNVQKIVIEKEENEKLYKALSILTEFRDIFDNIIDETNLAIIDELNDLNADIDHITEKLEHFLDELGYCDYIEIKG